MASELVDVIAQAIRVADGDHTMGTGELAEHIAALFLPIGWYGHDEIGPKQSERHHTHVWAVVSDETRSESDGSL